MASTMGTLRKINSFIVAPSFIVLMMVLCPVTSRTMDQIIAGAASSVQQFDQIHDMEGNQVIHELDMVMTIEQYTALTADDTDENQGGRYKRKATRYSQARWPDKTIPYVFSSRAGFTSSNLDQIRKAMEEWERYTCIRFEQRTNRHSSYVTFDTGNGCYSYVGMTGGSQTIGLAAGCRYKGVVVHEIGHAVGFHHEQNRPDRDEHVTILFENIPQSVQYNFKKYSKSAINTYDVPYDYKSVMHYGGKAFSHNGQYTIKTNKAEYQNVIGNREGLSFNDIKLANLMYDCSDHCSDNDRARCPSYGFLDKDCQCMCPGSPVRQCGGTTSKPVTSRPEVTTTPPPTTCKDMNEYCPAWADTPEKYCYTNEYVRLYCKASCGTCDEVVTQKPITCQDKSQHCDYYKGMGYCTGVYEQFMRGSCAKTCKTCSLSSDNSEENAALPLANWFVTIATTLLLVFVSIICA